MPLFPFFALPTPETWDSTALTARLSLINWLNYKILTHMIQVKASDGACNTIFAYFLCSLPVDKLNFDNWSYKAKRQTKESQDAPDEAS